MRSGEVAPATTATTGGGDFGELQAAVLSSAASRMVPVAGSTLPFDRRNRLVKVENRLDDAERGVGVPEATR